MNKNKTSSNSVLTSFTVALSEFLFNFSSFKNVFIYIYSHHLSFFLYKIVIPMKYVSVEYFKRFQHIRRARTSFLKVFKILLNFLTTSFTKHIFVVKSSTCPELVKNYVPCRLAAVNGTATQYCVLWENSRCLSKYRIIVFQWWRNGVTYSLVMGHKSRW